MDCRSNLDPSFFPTPSALVTFRSAEGRCCLLPSPWMGVVWNHPAVLTLAFRHGTPARALIRNGEGFVVSLPPDDLVSRPAFREWLTHRQEDMAHAPGLSPWYGMASGIAGIEQCPVHLECAQGVLGNRYGQDVLSGTLIGLYINQKPLPIDKPLNFSLYTRVECPLPVSCS